jgi:hypothetical protein
MYTGVFYWTLKPKPTQTKEASVICGVKLDIKGIYYVEDLFHHVRHLRPRPTTHIKLDIKGIMLL